MSLTQSKEQVPSANYGKRFFHFPIEKVLTKLRNEENQPIVFNESQWAMVHGLENHRFWVHIAGRRTGKSFAAAVLAFTKLLEPNTRIAVVSPDFNLSGIIWDYLTKMIKDLGIETDKFSNKERVIILKNGSIIRLLSANKRESLIGRGYHLVIVDEAAIIENEDYFVRDIRPTLSTFENTRCLFISTPRGKHNYLHTYFQRGQPESHNEYPDWGSDVFTWRSNPRLRPEEIEEARRSMTKTLFEQEYECNWLSFENMIYNIPETSILQNLYTTNVSRRKMEYIAGLDMGFKDSTAFIVIATDYENYYIIDEYVTKETVTSEMARNITELQQKYDIQNIYIDSQAQQTRADLANDYDIYCDNAIKSVEDGIGHVQNLLEKGKILIDEIQCHQTLAALQQYKWSKSTVKPTPVHDWTSHCSDAVRYAIYSHQKTQVDIYTG